MTAPFAADGDGTAADPRSDHELLAAHVAGDPDAFALLLGRHRNRLWGLALRTLTDREDAADALQDALLKAHRAAASFRGDSAVSTWLHRIVVNACLDRIRRDLRRPADPTEPDRLEPAASDRDRVGADRGGDVGDAVALRLDVEAALAGLAPEQRAALVLVDVLGHDVESAAELLGCPVGTVKSRCSRGRARLAPALAHLWNQDGSSPVEPGAVRTSSAAAAPATPATGTDQPPTASTDGGPVDQQRALEGGDRG